MLVYHKALSLLIVAYYRAGVGQLVSLQRLLAKIKNVKTTSNTTQYTHPTRQGFIVVQHSRPTSTLIVN